MNKLGLPPLNDTPLLRISRLEEGLDFITRLPLASPLRAETLLNQLLDGLLANPPEASTYLELLEQVRIPLCFVEEELAHRYHNKPLPLGDVDASTRPDRERSRLRATSVGFVFQDSELDPSRPILDSVVEPGLYAGLERQTLEDRARALLERFGLAHRADHRPGQVSGGQAQRVAVCRALVNAPAVVLADEPTGNLDPDNAGLVMDALADAAAEGRTVVVATHDPAVVARADEVVRL